MSISERDERMAVQVAEMHAVLLGVDDQGGLVRKVERHDADIAALKGWRSKVAGIWIGVTALLALLGYKLSEIFNGK